MSPATGFARAAVGLAQGGILYMLYQALERKEWPATDATVFSPLAAVAVFVPLILIVGLVNLRPRTLAIWVAAATALCVSLAVYDMHREGVVPLADFRPVMQPPFWIALAAMLFILHALIVAGDTERRFVAGYPTYFDISWKLVAQIVLAASFTGTFWLLLWLGAELFRLIKLEFLHELIQRRFFWIPVTTLAAAAALHVTDVSAGLVRGMRTLKLTLLSWLLPMMTLFAVAFVLALPFTGLGPLWSTRRATFILLSSAAALVVLINAAYQDGQPDAPVAAILRYARLAAAFVIAPLVILAGFGLMLRVQQYGWTPPRVYALACFAVLACYALGYGLAGSFSGPALRGLQATNVGTACVVLAVLLILFSPIADPARISVADQISRLRSGQTPPDNMDFRFLRFDSGRFGKDALRQLAGETEGPQAAIAQRATQALAMTQRYQPVPAFVPTTQSRAANITVIQPAGQALPESFLKQDWAYAPGQPFALPTCLIGNMRCEAIMIDMDGDGRPEVLLFNLPGGTATAFKAAEDDKSWSAMGLLLNAHCKGVREALREGRFAAVAPGSMKEIEVAGQRLRINSGCA